MEEVKVEGSMHYACMHVSCATATTSGSKQLFYALHPTSWASDVRCYVVHVHMSDECETAFTSVCTVPADRREGRHGRWTSRNRPGTPEQAPSMQKGGETASRVLPRVSQEKDDRYLATYVRDEIPRRRSAPDMLETDFSGSRHPPPRSLFLGKGRRAEDSAASAIYLDIHVCVGFTVSQLSLSLAADIQALTPPWPLAGRI